MLEGILHHANLMRMCRMSILHCGVLRAFRFRGHSAYTKSYQQACAVIDCEDGRI